MNKVKCIETSKMHRVVQGEEYEVVGEEPKKYKIKINSRTSIWVFAFNFKEVSDKKGFDKFMDTCDIGGLEEYR